MKAVLPGRPPPKLQALVTASWNKSRIIAYISGWTVVILGGPNEVLQTVYLEDTTFLDTIAIDEDTGKIAVSSGSNVYIYEPFVVGGVPKWSLSHNFRATCDFVRTLSFGIANELLLGGSQLELWDLSEPHLPRLIWSTKLANPVKFAEFSYDGTYIASTGQYDRVLKIWKRMTFGTDDVSFEVSYLRHPTVVTSIHWRRPRHREASVENALYTVCADNKFRIWIAGDHVPPGPSFRHWAEIDMEKSIQHNDQEVDRNQRHGKARRYGFMVSCHDFCAAIERAVQRNGAVEDSPVLDYLTKVASRTPEIFLVLDGQNHMCAWGIEDFNPKGKSPASSAAIFEIAHVGEVYLSFAPDASPEEDYARFVSFSEDDKIVYLAHHFDGRIEWVESQVDVLFDSSPRKRRVHTNSIWSGHDGIIKKIVRDVSGNVLVSRTNDNTALIWHQKRSHLVRQSTLHSDDHIRRSCILDGGQFMMNLHHDGISLWDVRSSSAKCLANCVFDMESKPLCVLQLPTVEVQTSTVYVAAAAADMSGIVWEISLPEQPDQAPLSSDKDEYDHRHHHYPKIEKFCSFRLEGQHDFSYILPIDPAGSRIRISGFLDVFAVDIAISYTKTGTITTWTAKIDHTKRAVDWLETSTVETGIQDPSLASGTSIRKAAMVNDRRNELTIWDTRTAQLEFQETFGQEDVIRDLDWTSTPDDQSILAVGFPHKVIFLSQLRYDYLDETASWAPIREISIRNHTPHPIGDSCWLGNGAIIVGAGNQLYIYSKEIDATNPMVSRLRLPLPSKPDGAMPATANLFDVVTRLNGALPVFHPQFLSQSILAGKMKLVHLILTLLNRKLKFFTPGDFLDGFLGIPLEVIYNDGFDLQHNLTRTVNFTDGQRFDEDESYVLNEPIAASLQENLTRVALPQLSSGEQFRLLDIVQCVVTIETYRRSMDDNATRFLLFFREHLMRKGQKLHNLPTVSWREIVWAQHSDSHEILTDFVSRQYNGKLLWENAKECGMFMWLSNATALKAQLEVVARNEYMKTEERNPIDCSLFYFALGKKNVIQGLWRMAHWNREQKPTSQFLGQDFKQTRWKRAALKNAFALLSKRRFQYAAAFFLLGGGVRDAAYICLNKLGDVQLAITIARVCEGDDSPLLRELLQEHILPTAAAEGNRWMATWAFWLLKRRDLAVRALIDPIERLVPQTVLNNTPGRPASIPLHAKSYLANDPALIVLYQQLREKTLQTMKGASQIRGKDEWGFISRTAGLYSRMGCDLLALNLVSHWQFLSGPDPVPQSRREEAVFQGQDRPPEYGKIDDGSASGRLWASGNFRRKSSLVIADLPTAEERRHDKETGEEDRPEKENAQNRPSATTTLPSEKKPTYFVEPDANAMLDNFGF